MSAQNLFNQDQDPTQALEFIKNRTNNNINWEKLKDTSEELAKANNTTPEMVAYELVKKYSTPDENGQTLFNIQPKEDKSQAPSKETLDSYESNLTSLDGLKNLGLDVIDTIGFSGFSNAASERKRKTDIYLREQAQKGTPYDELHEQAYWQLDGLKGSSASRLAYENLKKEQDILQKGKANLSDEEKEFINKRVNPISHFFSEYVDEDYKEFEDKATESYVAQDVQSKLAYLNNIHQNKSFKSILLGSDENTKNEYLQSAQTIAQTAGFEGIAYDNKGDVYFYDSERIYKPNQDFFGNFLNILSANAGSIGGGISGAILGAKNAKTPQQLLAGSIIGAGLGSAAGASADVLIANARLDRKNTLKETLAHSLEEGLLSVVGDVAILGGSEAIKRGFKVLKNTDTLKNVGNVAQNIIEYTPILGFVSRFQNGNSKAALKLIDNSIDPAKQQAIKEFGESFGGGINFDKFSNSKAYENIKARFGEEHFITKGAKVVNDAFMLGSQTQTQRHIMQNIRADDSGNLLAFLAEAANASPNLQKNLKYILNQTTFNLKKQLEYLDLKPNEIKEIFNHFEKGTKQEYQQAINDVLVKVFDDKYKVVLSKDGVHTGQDLGLKQANQKISYNEFRKKLDDSGVLPQDSMAFLSFVENNIYNKNGVTFEQLNNALKTLNSYYKQAQDPNFASFVKQSVEGFLKEDIKAGIDQIFAQNKELYKDASALFASALSDYAKMKSTIKIVDKLKLRDESISYQKAYTNLYNYLKGQGGDIDNLTRLTKDLDPSQATRLEINILSELFNQHLRDFDDVQVFDSAGFLKSLEGIKEYFKSQSAKDFIDIAKGFDTLFKNDVLIAQALRKATTEKISSSIATSIEGAAKFQMVRMMFENIVRVLPHIPFLGGLNEKIQGAALRFHIKSALLKNLDIQDFKITLSNKVKTNKELNSQTKEILQNIIHKVNQAQDDIIENLAKTSQSEVKQSDNVIANTDEAIQKENTEHSLTPKETKEIDNDTITRKSTDNTNNSNISNTNTLDSQLHTTPQGNERVMGDISTQSRVHREGGLRESTQLQDISFSDTKGKEHILTKETQEQWLKTFELENLEQSYIPKHSEEIKQALGGKEIRLQKGSLLKLVSQGREEFIPQIKAVLDEPEAILYDIDDGFLFIKHLKDEDYFVNVSYDKGEYLVSVSNGIKETNNLKNKLDSGAKVLYQSPSFRSSRNKLLQTSQSSANKIDNVDSTTNSQTPQTLTKQQAYHKIVGEYGKIFKKLPKVLADKDIDSILRDTKILADIRKRSFDERGFNPRLAELAAQDYFRKDKAINAFIYKAREYGLDLGFNSFMQFFKKRYGTQIKNDEQAKDMLASLGFFKSLKIDENPQRFTDIKMSEDKSGFNSYVESKINKYLGIDEMAKKLTHNPKFDKLQAMLDLYVATRKTKNPKDIQKVEQYANTLRPFFPFLVNKNTSDFLYEIHNLAYSAHNLLQGKVYISLDSDFVYPQREAIEYFLDIKPLKEFGKNYAEYFRDGQRGIDKILAEAKDYEVRKEAGKLTEAEIEQGAYKGQVAGAFYKEGLGDIDLVWGEITDATNHKGFGLSHILDKRTAEFMQEGLSEREAKAKAEELIGKIPNIVENGKVVELGNGKIRIVTDDYTIGMKNEWHNKPTNPYILTTFENNKKSDKNLHSTAFTKGETLPLNSKADSTTKPFKQQDISFESFENFSRYAKLSGIEFESEAQEREAYKYIQSKLKSLEY